MEGRVVLDQRHRLEPRWQEVIVLLAGLMDDPQLLLELLADERSDDLYRHRLALAALALSEVPACRRGQCPELIDLIMDDVDGCWWRSCRSYDESEIARWTRILPALVGLGANPIDDRLVSIVLHESFHSDKAIEALGQLGMTAVKPHVLDALVAHLGKRHVLDRPEAAEALGRMGPAAASRREVVDALLSFLSTKRRDDEAIRIPVVEALGQMGPAAATQEVVDALLALYHSGGAEPRICSEAQLRRGSAPPRFRP